MHSLGWVHNDIKLENILIGYRDPSKIYLIDFGLSQAYLEPHFCQNITPNGVEGPPLVTYTHILKQNLAYFSGNFMFASLNSCRGNNKSRRDDIESIFYLFIYLYNNNYLPWRDFKGTFKQMVIQRLQLKVTKSLFKMIPPIMEDCLKYVLLLNYDEEPKYDYLIEELKKAYNQLCMESGEKPQSTFKSPIFDWNVSLATRF